MPDATDAPPGPEDRGPAGRPPDGDGPDDPRRRVRRALLGRPGVGQLVVGGLLGLLGFAAAVQVNAVDSDDAYAGARRGDLVQLLETLSAAQDRATRQLAELEDTRDALELDSNEGDAALEEAQRQLEALLLLSGQVGAAGPGVIITIQDPDGAIAARTLLNAIEELRDSGAEAIEVNNSARVVAQTWFGDGPDPADASLVVDGASVSAPYVLEAIGAPETLAEAVRFPGGLADEVEALGGTVAVVESDTVQIDSLAPEQDPDVAAPAT